jgi:hypothetical protein
MPNLFRELGRGRQNFNRVMLWLYPAFRIKDRPKKNRDIVISCPHHTARHPFIRRSFSKCMTLSEKKLVQRRARDGQLEGVSACRTP